MVGVVERQRIEVVMRRGLLIKKEKKESTSIKEQLSIGDFDKSNGAFVNSPASQLDQTVRYELGA